MENISMCLVAFQKIFRKIFSSVWKRRRKTQIQKNTSHNPEKTQTQFKFFLSDLSPARSREGEIAIDGSSSRISRSSSTDLPLGSLAGAISRRRDGDQRRDLAVVRSWSTARSRDGEIMTNGAISRRRDRVRRFSSRARAHSLSLSHFPEMLWRENRSVNLFPWSKAFFLGQRISISGK